MGETSDLNWDFQAPSYMDFTSAADRLDDGADKFFDLKKAEMIQASMDDGEFNNNSRLTFDVAPQRVSVKAKPDEQVESTCPMTENNEGDKENIDEIANQAQNKIIEVAKPKEKVPSNIMTPSRLATWNKPTLSKSNVKNKAAPQNKTTTTIKRSASLRSSTSTTLSKARELRTRRSVQTTDEPARKRTKSNNSTPILKHKRANSANFAIPNVLKRQPQTATQRHQRQNSEQRELEEIKELREKVKRDKQIAAESLKKFTSAKPTSVAHTKTTAVQEFHFETDKRSKVHPMKTRHDNEMKAADFTKGLRSHPESPKKGAQLQITQVQPFKLSEGKKRKLDVSGADRPPFVPVPMAKMILDFHKSTPSRFRTRNKNAKPEPQGPMRVPRITKAITPKLASTSRHRPVSVVSEAEKEEKELEEIKKNEFKAQPIKANLFDGPEPLKKVEKKPTTVAVGFKLHEVKKSLPKPEKFPTASFKAQPCPSFDKVTGVREKPRISFTLPESPAFALKNRIKPKKAEPEAFEMKSYYKPVPLCSGIKNHSYKKAPLIKAVPFSFEGRDRERRAKLKERIEEIKESETKIKPFKANDMPSSDTASGLPPKVKAKTTKAVAPQFVTEGRAGNRVAEWTTEVDKDVSELRKAALFKAQQMPNPQAKWEPKKLHKAPTEPLDVQLASDRRALERQELKKRQQEQQAELQAVEQAVEEERKRKEQVEILELRKKMVIKANPIPLTEAFVVTGSSKICTVPESPKFSDRFTK